MKQNNLSIHEALKEQDLSERQRKVVELIKNGANVNVINILKCHFMLL